MFWHTFPAAPRNHLVLCARSRARLECGRVREALEDAAAAVRARPEWAAGHLSLGAVPHLQARGVEVEGKRGS